MKKIFVFLLLMVVSFAVKAQYPITQNLGADSTLIYVKGAVRTVGGFINGTYTDTAAANLTRIRQYQAAQIFTTNDSAIWFRMPGATKWVRIMPATPPSPNVDTSYWSLSGNYVADRVATPKLGTTTGHELNIITNDSIRLTIPVYGITRVSGANNKYLVIDTTIGSNMYVGYMDGGSGSNYTAGNGLTLSGSQFKLGSPLTENTTITTTGYNFNLLGIPTVSSTTGRKIALIDTVTGKVEKIDASTLNSNIYNTDGIIPGQRVVTIPDGSELQFFLDVVGKFNVTNDAGDTLFYALGNSGLYLPSVPTVSSTTGRKVALIDTATGKVERIDPASLVSTYTAGNGLTLSGSQFKWGGTLTDDTTLINQDNKRLRFYGNETMFDSLRLTSAGEQDFTIRHRLVGLGFPVTTIKPTGNSSKNIAFDIMPTGTPGNYSDNGIAWIDVCDSDVSAGAGATATARVSITSSAVQFGSRSFGGASDKPVEFVVDTDTRMTLSTSNTATFNIGKITQSQNLSSDYVGYSLFNTNNTTSGGDAIFFIGQDIGALTHGFLRYNNNASVTQGSKTPNSFQIAANANATGGLNIAALASNGRIKFFIGGSGGVEAMRIDSNRRVGIGTTTPERLLHTSGTVRHASLGTASIDTTTYKPLGIDTNGDLIPMSNWYGGGGGSVSSASGTGVSLVNGSSLIKRLKAGTGITITDNTDSVTIANTITTLNDLTDVTITSPKKGQLNYYDSTTSQWINGYDIDRRMNVAEFWEDFLFANPAPVQFNSRVSGGAFSDNGLIATASGYKRPGVYSFYNGGAASTASLDQATWGNYGIFFKSGVYQGETRYSTSIMLSDLATAGDDFDLYFGLQNLYDNEPTTGVYFKYDRGTYGDSIVLVSANGGTRTNIASTTMFTADEWIKLEFVINADATEIRGYVNGTEITAGSGTYPITTNISTQANPQLPPVLVFKTSASTGASRVVYIDYVGVRQIIPNGR